MPHFVSKSCQGESCLVCSELDEQVPATHKVSEEIPHDDPNECRMSMSAYVCCICYGMIFGTTCTPESAA